MTVQERNSLVLANLGLSYAVARAFKRSWPFFNRSDFDDAIGVAMLSLVKAADTWPQKHYRFSTWAGLAIQSDLIKHFQEFEQIIRVPHSRKEEAVPKVLSRLLRSSDVVIKDLWDDSDRFKHWELVQELLNKMTPCRRQAVVMHFFEGKCIAEISKDLGRPYASVYRMVYPEKRTRKTT